MLNINQTTPFESLSEDAFKKTVRSCNLCDLCQTRTNVVFGMGPIPCDLMIIGEGPGEQEDKQGKPFVGRAGQLLTKILGSVGINRETETFITNTVKCRPPNNRTPHPSEIESCKPYLIKQIQIIKPKVLVLLGAPALKTILEGTLSISKARGKWYQMKVSYMEEILYVMPIFHPSYLLRNASQEKGKPKWLTWHDMKEVKEALSFYKKCPIG